MDEKKEEEKTPPAEIMEKIPPQAKKGIMEFFGMMMQSYSGPIPQELLKKITPQHIDKLLDSSEKDSERDFENSKLSKRYTLVYVCIVSLIFIFLTVYLVGKETNLYKEILEKILFFTAGLTGGYGIRVYFEKKA